MTVRPEPPLEAELDVVRVAVAGVGRQHRRLPAAVSRAADEVEPGILGDAALVELGLEPADKIRHERSGGKLVPFQKQGRLAERRQHRRADIGPLGPGAHIDQRRVRRLRQTVPRSPGRDVTGIAGRRIF